MHTIPFWLSGFLSWTMRSFTFPSESTVNILVEAQECHATNIFQQIHPLRTLFIVFLTNERLLAGEHNFSGFFCFPKPSFFR